MEAVGSTSSDLRLGVGMPSAALEMRAILGEMGRIELWYSTELTSSRPGRSGSPYFAKASTESGHPATDRMNVDPPLGARDSQRLASLKFQAQPRGSIAVGFIAVAYDAPTAFPRHGTSGERPRKDVVGGALAPPSVITARSPRWWIGDQLQ